MMNEHTTSDTKARIVATAEELFASQGFERTTLRQVTRQARVNIAAANYHFVDKASLFRAVFLRRLQPINQSRLTRLQEAQALAGNEPVDLEVILRIFFNPLFDLCRDETGGGKHFAQILGRAMAEPVVFMDQVLDAELHPVTAQFAQALRRHAPSIPPDDFLWRISFIVGAFHHTLSTINRINELTQGICKNGDYDRTLARLVQYSVYTIKAPPSTGQAPREEQHA